MRHVNIEPTNKCNLNCAYCGDRKSRKIGFMDLRTYKKIINQIPIRTEIRLFLSGEPFLHPKIMEMIEFALRRGHVVLIHSNGTALTHDQVEKLVDLGIDYPFTIYLNFTMHGNFVPEVVDYLIGIHAGLNIIFQKILPYPEPIEIPEYMKRYHGKVKFNIRHPHNWDKKDSIKDSEPADYKGVCGFLQDSIAIYWDGTVTTCCADLNGDRVIGHIDDGFAEIEKKYDELARTFKDKNHICKGCERHATEGS